MSDADAAARAAERVARESYGRLIAFLAARTGDVAGAEDALGDAFATALRVWPTDGVPDNPGAWLLTAARRRQTDVLRRRQTATEREPEIQTHMRLISDEIDDVADGDDIPDRRLALMFACAHPAIESAMRAPLILQTILGFNAQEIASAFLIPPATMGQRLVRAKSRIRDAAIPFRVPEPDELPERLRSVLDAIYAAYSKGWNEIGDSGVSEITDEAMWLGHLVVSLSDASEAKGMLALMLYAEARRAARRDAAGAYVPLEQQDTALWDLSQIAHAERLLHDASTSGPTGRFQLEAAIQSAHTARRITGESNWPVVVQLYDHLLALTNSPVVALNRAMALAEIHGPELVLNGALAELASDKRMAGYQPYWAARGHLLARSGRAGEANEAFTVAIGLTTDPAARAYLQRQRASLRHV